MSKPNDDRCKTQQNGSTPHSSVGTIVGEGRIRETGKSDFARRCSSEAAPRGRSLLLIYMKLAAMTMIWGGTFIAGRAVVQTVGPFSVAFCRYALATVCLVLLSVKMEGGLPKLRRNLVLPVVLLGLSGVFAFNAFFFLGLQTTTASRASLIVTTNPAVIALCAAFIFKDKLTLLKLLGIFASLAGAAIVITDGNPLVVLAQGVGVGDLYLLGCVFSWTVYTLVGKQVMTVMSPLAATTYASLVGTPIFLIAALKEGMLQNLQSFSFSNWLSIFYLASLGSIVAFLFYYEGLKAIGAAKTAIFITLVPVLTATFAAVLFKEPLPPTLVLGGVLVVIGVSLTNRS